MKPLDLVKWLLVIALSTFTNKTVVTLGRSTYAVYGNKGKTVRKIGVRR